MSPPVESATNKTSSQSTKSGSKKKKKMPFDILCVPKLPTEQYDTEAGTYECDYDKNPTSLYEAIQEKAWIPALHFFQTGSWEQGGLFFQAVQDPLPVERQARTWVTRFEADGKVRWSQLPLHAALIFGAPFQLIQHVVKLYPQGVRCTDDQHMLPLHLAMKFGSDDAIVSFLLDNFPESIFTKDIRGRLPTEVPGPNQHRNQMLEQIIAVMTKTLTKRHGHKFQDGMADMRDDLVLQHNLNADLERDKRDLEDKLQKAHKQLDSTQTKLEVLEHKQQLMAKSNSSKLHVLQSSTSRVKSSSSKATGQVAGTRSSYKKSANVNTGSSSGVDKGQSGTRERSLPPLASPREDMAAPTSAVAKSQGKNQGSRLEPELPIDSPSNSKRSTRGFFKGFGGAKE